MPTQTSRQYKFPFPKVVPDFMLQYIKSHGNVGGDGNCGFRVVASFVYGDENRWNQVRMDLTTELVNHEELYRTRFALGCQEDFDKALDILNWRSSPAPDNKWYCVSRLGPVVATTYQTIFTYWDPELKVTFLPLETRPLIQSSTFFMSMARIGGNHFIPLYLSFDCPLPKLSIMWKKNRHEDVERIFQGIKNQLDKFCELNNSL